jgi:PilZ domain
MEQKQNSPQSAPAKRHLTNESAVIEIYGRSGKILCKMNNLSVTGAFFEIVNSQMTPKQGDLVRISINLRKLNKTHNMHGIIVWSKGLGVGISFMKTEDLVKLVAKPII